MNIQSIFEITTQQEFNAKAIEVFSFQYRNNAIYHEFCSHLGKQLENVKTLADIPFLPIEFFKRKKVVSTNEEIGTVFTSSGTTGFSTSKHYVYRLELYEQSYLRGFQHFYGPVHDYCILALLPSYLERKGSSLILMVDDLIKRSEHVESGFYLDELDFLKSTLLRLEASGTKTLLLGVSFALLDFVEKHPMKLRNTIVMETGGMKGRRKEMIRTELHETLKRGFGIQEVHSEYGMTELLSQAYSDGHGNFKAPPWMKVLTRDPEDPLTNQAPGKTGGLNIIDLANVYSCSFIATQDLGKISADGSFEILGRFDNSDIRGCNLMLL